MDLNAVMVDDYATAVERPWTDEDDAILREWRSSQGYSWGTVAQGLDRRPADVANHARLVQDGTLTEVQKSWLRRQWVLHRRYVLLCLATLNDCRATTYPNL